jgi:hypothetical protein
VAQPHSTPSAALAQASRQRCGRRGKLEGIGPILARRDDPVVTKRYGRSTCVA